VIKKYSKSSQFYNKLKNNYFENNKELLHRQLKINSVYLEQPLRTHCKLCSKLLPVDCDFHSHSVGYKFCSFCGHINGEHEDTEDFFKRIYVDNNDINYSSNYIDDNYLDRVNNIYAPKADFLIETIKSKDIGVLDIGCGSGHFVCALLDKGERSQGIDVSAGMIKYGNKQISLLHGHNPLIKTSESGIIKQVNSTKLSIISAIGVIEHLRYPQQFFKAFQNSNAQYLYACVPMFSLSVYVENIFKKVYPRHLSGGHTHIFSNESLEWMYQHYQLEPIAEWRFGSDVTDLFRSASVFLQDNNSSQKFSETFKKFIGNEVDTIQEVIDKCDFSSEIHFIARKIQVK
jgi:2-polyprenyl-3-methyl-5-hydroxy-6-metoxy-1,4-benzoquinol methylase